MGRNINSSRLTKQYILDNVSQVTIFSTYLSLPNSIIQHCIDTGDLIISPLRDDNHPTCGFKYDVKGKLKFKDFAGYFWGDCFDVVAFVMANMYNIEINISKKQDFIKVLRHITLTFKNIFYGEEKDITLINEINSTIAKIKNKKPKIELVVRSWNLDDESYWKQFKIPLSFLNTNFIYAVEQYYINKKVNPEPKYYYDCKDPCYAYLLGKDKYGTNNIKLYFPKRNKKDIKFITNCNHLEGIYNLDKNNYDIIVLTKSTKDRLAIASSIKRCSSLYGGEIAKYSIGLINIPHETYKLRQNEYDWLKSKIKNNGHIISLMDNDETGVCESKWLKDNYNILPILIPYRYKCKDFAELVVKYNDKHIIKFILKVIKYLEHYDRINIQFIRFEKNNSTIPY